MKTFKTLAIAAVAALSLGAGAAMAQEGPRATESGSSYFGTQVPTMQAPAARAGMVQSGSSDVETLPSSDSHYYWTPGVPYNNEGGEG